VAELHAGTFCDFPDGDFEFEVSSNAPVELVSVWKFIFDEEGKLGRASARSSIDVHELRLKKP
jgi:hypothetical protein